MLWLETPRWKAIDRKVLNELRTWFEHPRRAVSNEQPWSLDKISREVIIEGVDLIRQVNSGMISRTATISGCYMMVVSRLLEF